MENTTTFAEQINSLNNDDLEYESLMKELSDEHDVINLLSFNETDIQNKLSINAAKIWHFTELWHKEKNTLDKIFELKDILIGNLYDYYKSNGDRLLKQGEIEKYYIPKDVKMVRITQIIRKQQWRVEFYDALRKALEKQQWNMKTFLDSMRSGL